jgi:beta-lactamase regulating signal transducer with metallopeptidase domain
VSELIAALLGAGLVFGIAVPLVTLVAKAVLLARWRHNPDPKRQGSLSTYMLIIAPSIGAVAWFISAALHLSEPGAAGGICALDHGGAAMCLDALLFAGLLAGLAATAMTRGWLRAGAHWQHRAERLPADDATTQRLQQVCAAHPRLRALRSRISAVDGDTHPVCTRGLFRPVIEVSKTLMSRLNDSALTAALLHEAEHHDARDPLRFLVATVSLALNPCGFLLRSELARWRAGREVVCDEWAVRRAADPLSLADALVAAARIDRPLPAFSVALGGNDKGLLRLRIHFLLDYATRPPGRPSRTPILVGVGAMLAVLTLPHAVGAWPLDIAHAALERTLVALGLI